jgi:hypothetical protein
VRAVQAITTTIPIVSAAVSSDIVFTRPGGNVTGVYAAFGDLGGKRIGLLHELLPRATTIAVLTIPSALVPVDRSVLAGIRNPSQNRPPVRRSYVSFRRERTWSRSAVRWSGHRILLRTLRGPCSFRTHQGLQRAGAGTLSRSVGCGGGRWPAALGRRGKVPLILPGGGQDQGLERRISRGTGEQGERPSGIGAASPQKENQGRSCGALFYITPHHRWACPTPSCLDHRHEPCRLGARPDYPGW